MPFDDPPDRPDQWDEDDEPKWDPSGWSPVYFGHPKQPDSQLLGHTKLRLEWGVRRFKVSYIDPESKAWYLGGDMLQVLDSRSGEMM